MKSEQTPGEDLIRCSDGLSRVDGSDSDQALLSDQELLGDHGASAAGEPMSRARTG